MKNIKYLAWLGGCLLFLALALPASAKFPDAHNAPPTGWTGPVFTLSQAYPTTLPPPEAYPWKAFDFKTQPDQYIHAVLDYAIEGNIDPAVDWQVEKNPIRKWYHAPWMHVGPSGREFIHGMTKERSSRPRDLHANQTGNVQNWAVGFYNPPGGYVIGQVWKDPENPDPSAARFPDGTVSVKLLFTQATDAAGPMQVPFLVNSKTWQADINRNANASGSNVPTLRLLQMDVAVRDVRAKTLTGWVFGTFIYNGNAPGATVWERMIPVGLMWGNDKTITPTKIAAGAVLKESWINPAAKPLVTHLGWAGRLNGPVDNPISSCLSCHSTAQSPQVSGMTPRVSDSDTVKLRWFRNIKAGKPFDVAAGVVSLDYSLQLAAGIQNFQAAHGADINADVGSIPMVFTASGARIFPVSRDSQDEQSEDVGAANVPAPADAASPNASSQTPAADTAALPETSSWLQTAAIVLAILVAAVAVVVALRVMRKKA